MKTTSGHIRSEVRKLNVSSKKEINYSKRLSVGQSVQTVSYTALLKIERLYVCFVERFCKSNFLSLMDLETYNFFKIPEKILQKSRNTNICTNTLL